MARVKRYAPYRYFDGKGYGRNVSYDTKQAAMDHAKRLRQSGDRARVTRDKLLTGKTIYVTWLRKGS